LFNLFKQTPTLITSAENGDLVNVRRLLQKGEDVNVMDSEGNTALTLACYNKHSNVALEILKRDNLDVNVCNACGVTCLMAASRNELWDVVGELLKHEIANWNFQWHLGYTALMWEQPASRARADWTWFLRC
jgi:uncharacterized protein